MEKREGVMDGIRHSYFRCEGCNEEILDMQQLKALASKYREMRRAKDVTFSRWGNSLAVRIPKEVVEDLRISAGSRGLLTKDKKGIRIIPE